MFSLPISCFYGAATTPSRGTALEGHFFLPSPASKGKTTPKPIKTHPTRVEPREGLRGGATAASQPSRSLPFPIETNGTRKLGKVNRGNWEEQGRTPGGRCRAEPCPRHRESPESPRRCWNTEWIPGATPERGWDREQHHQSSPVHPSKEGLIKTNPLPLHLRQTFPKKSLRGHCFCPVFQYIKCNYFIVDLPVIRGMCLNMIY